MKLNEKQIEEYLRHKGVCCPYCVAPTIEGGFVETGAGNARQKMRCTDCGRTWTDVYMLTGIEEDPK